MILSDFDIAREMNSGRLIRGGVAGRVWGACYELRLGKVYYDLTEDGRRFEIEEDGCALIKPGHRVVLISREEVVVPENMIARICHKGSLFSIGLSPVSTYADPGFEGHVGIVTQNISDKYIVIPAGEAIAKVDFNQLTRGARSPYHGQHGFQTQIWPIQTHLQRTFEQVRNDPRMDTEAAESYKVLPKATVRSLLELQSRQTLINWALLATIILNALLLGAVSLHLLDTMCSIATNLAASAIVGVVLWVAKVRG